jgi:hypothetical protein
MQIALVAVVLLAGMWFTVLKPKPADSSAPVAAATPAATPTTASSAPVAPGVKGLASAIDKAKAASATSDATNAKIQSATGGTASTAAPAATATKTSTAAKSTAPKSTAKAKATKPAAAKPGTKAAPAAAATTAKPITPKPAVTKAAPTAAAKPAAPATPAADVDPSDRLLAYLSKGKTLVILFEGKGADDKAARTAVHRTAKADPKHVISAYVPITDVGKYEAITSDVEILAAPTVLVIGTDGKATPLAGYVDAGVIQQAVADARRNAAATAK